MRTTGIFTVHSMKVPLASSAVPLTIVPFGDVHDGSPFHAAAEWDRDLREAKKLKQPLFIGVGDYFDFMSTSERRGVRASEFHDSTMDQFEIFVKNQVKRFARKIEFMKGRMIGLIEGNHYYEFSDGTTSTMYLADLMGCKYLGVMSLIRLQVCVKGSHFSYDICAYHGKGAARLHGSSLNTVQYMAEGAVADLYMMGHDHRRGAVPGTMCMLKAKPRTGEIYLSHRDRYFVRTGSYLKAFEDGKPSYVADGGGAARSLGGIQVQVRFHRDASKMNANPESWVVDTKVLV